MTKKCIPHLGGGGYVTEPKEMLSLMFANAFEIRHNDSNLFPEYIVSIQKIVAVNQKNPTVLVSELAQALTSYIERVFDRAEVSITSEDVDAATYNINIDVRAWSGNNIYSLGRVLSVDPTSTAVALIEEINR
ncbi:hypothetical protein [Vibrio phage vB_VmeM-Yong XC32]|nr:hypothetical protein [Vibrio phage vB_VmeM-Yong XC31]QAX96364.1 hypothetical protein [Vibrio phage vB_VmeM-Yong XC32]QAX96682.1 hypothetical protein [Vibrio phage vB_VmeM-Yong MS31]QAX97000.1 hypothetical protein [Vibrio phage vB_VmeM-Yong MS32]